MEFGERECDAPNCSGRDLLVSQDQKLHLWKSSSAEISFSSLLCAIYSCCLEDDVERSGPAFSYPDLPGKHPSMTLAKSCGSTMPVRASVPSSPPGRTLLMSQKLTGSNQSQYGEATWQISKLVHCVEAVMEMHTRKIRASRTCGSRLLHWIEDDVFDRIFMHTTSPTLQICASHTPGFLILAANLPQFLFLLLLAPVNHLTHLVVFMKFMHLTIAVSLKYTFFGCGFLACTALLLIWLVYPSTSRVEISEL